MAVRFASMSLLFALSVVALATFTSLLSLSLAFTIFAFAMTFAVTILLTV